jgi:MraZ protein
MVGAGGTQWVKVVAKGAQMAIFSGHKLVTFDNKFRVSMPSYFRDDLRNEYSNRIVLNKCLTGPEIDIWPKAEYDKFITEKILPLPAGHETDHIKWQVMAFAFQEELDGNGRIFVPLELRENFGSEKEVVIYGVGTRLMLATKVQWLGKVPDNPEEIRSTLAKFNIPY